MWYFYPTLEKRVNNILKQITGIIRVDKLCAILSMKADSNFVNELVFRYQLVESVMKTCWLSPETYLDILNLSVQKVAIHTCLTIFSD